jgi:hypothetical protein
MTDFEVFHDSVYCEVVNQMFTENPACSHVRTHAHELRAGMTTTHVFNLLIIHYTLYYNNIDLPPLLFFERTAFWISLAEPIGQLTVQVTHTYILRIFFSRKNRSSFIYI